MAHKRLSDFQGLKKIYEERHKKLTEDVEVEIDAEKESTEPVTNADPTPEMGPELGISDILISAINDEWNTISMYNNMIAQIDAEKYLDMIPVIQDIVAEENVHVGQLQKLLETISSNTQEIEKGELEADEQLSNPVEIE